ncbi:MAG: DUF202 domain-containing protein [Burkholderiaceae bacterium]
MIERFADHSANERTMLAWVRTALAIIALGMLVEKLNLFLRLSNMLDAQAADNARYAEWLGLGLIALGVTVIATSLLRYFGNARDIESERTIRSRAKPAAALLFLILSVGVIAIALFLARAVGFG